MSSQERVQAAISLDFDPDQLSTLYDGWAGSYEEDVHLLDYVGPAVMVEFFIHQIAEHLPNLKRANTEILDVGCGTGLVGQRLLQAGYSRVDGCDLSEQMVAMAREKKVYRNLFAGVDLSQANHHAWPANLYDATLCCGVFTHGHVMPSAVSELVRRTRSGGVVVLSTRTTFYAETEFEDEIERLLHSGAIVNLCRWKDKPYLSGVDAHYIALRVLTSTTC